MIDLRLLNDGQRRVLVQLRKGPIVAADFDLPFVVDGGKAITRVASRIGELKHKFGCNIPSERVPGPGGSWVARYTLVSEPEAGSHQLSSTQSTEVQTSEEVMSSPAVEDVRRGLHLKRGRDRQAMGAGSTGRSAETRSVTHHRAAESQPASPYDSQLELFQTAA